MFHLHFSISGGCSWEGLKRTPGGTKILFCGCGLNFFSSLRETNSKTTHYLLSYFCRFNILKGNHKAPTVELVRLNSSKDAKTAVITLKKVRRALPRPFYMGISQGFKQKKSKSWWCLDNWPLHWLFSILYLRFLLSFSVDWENKSNTQGTVWPHYQTPQSSSKTLRCASYFQHFSVSGNVVKHGLLCLIHNFSDSQIIHQV